MALVGLVWCSLVTVFFNYDDHRSPVDTVQPGSQRMDGNTVRVGGRDWAPKMKELTRYTSAHGGHERE